MTINKRYQMDSSLEIRKLSPKYVRELVQILETHELWKRLMSIIPKKLERDTYVCDITMENQHKYHSEHFKLIESASDKFKRACTEILLDEWGTSGRVRPALGHLLYLLKKAKLFRAADYVAVTLLNLPTPERPSSGPEALITVNLPETPKRKDTNLEEIEKILDDINYPSSAMLIIRSNSDEAARHNVPAMIPQIIISPDIDEDTRQAPDFTLPLVVQREKSEDKNEGTVSDMIKFSSKTVSTGSQSLGEIEQRPEISQLLCNSEANIPNLDLMNNSVDIFSTKESGEPSISTSESIDESPAFSQLLSNASSQNIALPLPQVETFENSQASEPNIPNLSALNNTISMGDLPYLSIFDLKQESSVSSGGSIADVMPNFDILRNTANNLEETSGEHISALLPNSDILNPRTTSVNISTHLLPTSTNNSHNSSDNSTKSRPCTSPLPNLSLNTLLPHFSYCELELATNSFDENPYDGTLGSGRFLGKGAFGSVFLALGLLDRLVAVKKLILEDVEVVNVDDTVTKQFRNEVEVLSKYKHVNLLSLLGYSCDGCTYCLMYEYIPGGALKDRLKVSENKLQWKQRLRIAMGTAKAVAYLHTAFSTPLIHRDIKSANILLDSKDNPKLCDFGLIKLSPSQNTSTDTTVFGTSAYMAPEAFRGDISVKLDTFSFGVVLLELLTSLPPMDEDRDGTDLVTHVEEVCENMDITPLLDKTTGSWQELEVNLAEELYKIAVKCLEEKKKRPNMVEVTAFLQNLVDKLSC